MIVTALMLLMSLVSPQTTTVAQLQPAQPTVVAEMQLPTVEGIKLEPEQLTIVKTWEVK
jgi:hypothetical protein